MRLKKIKLAGFKSFVDPTTIPFPGAMTAVVGPNGCGKSNVIDAVRWVLGESSAKNLRGDAMTDVIFNGSTGRKAVSQCSVELVFDNTSGRIAGEFANYNELSVKRMVTKDAVSSYLLNGTKCRKRDITDLFLGTGLGPRSYAIIEQGMISKLIESRPQELRVFVEEAAGISRYKERRRETENRIKHTKENLERLDDVRAELGQQQATLQKQAAAATRYKELKATERKLKAELAVVRWMQENELVKQCEMAISTKEIEFEAVIARKRADETRIIQYREMQENYKFEISDVQQEIFKASTDITKIEQSQLFSKKRKQQIQSELQQLNTQAQEFEALFADIADNLAIVREELLEIEPNKMSAEEAVENAQESRQKVEEELTHFTDAHGDDDHQYHSLKQSLQHCQGEIQNTISMQLRSESRIAELQQELHELEQNDIKQLIQAKQNQLLLVNNALEQARKDAQLSEQQHSKSQAEFELAKSEVDKQTLHLIKLQAQKDTLLSMHNKQPQAATGKRDQTAHFQFEADALALSEFLQIEPGFEGLCEIVFAHMAKSKVLPAASLELIPQDFYETKAGQTFLLENAMTSEKQVGSLAEKIHNPRVPHFLNLIRLSDDRSTALSLQSKLTAGYSILTHCGLWLFNDMLINGAGEHVDASLSRVAQIAKLTAQIAQQYDKLKGAEKTLTKQASALHKQNTLNSDSKSLSADYAEQALTLTTQLSLVQQQIVQQQRHKDRVLQELERYQLGVAEEAESRECLNEQAETYALQIAELEDAMKEHALHAESLQGKLQSARFELEQCVSKAHQLAMQVQQAKHTYNSLNEQQNACAEKISENKEKIAILSEEVEELSAPFDDQQLRLQGLLERKAILQNKQHDVQNQLAQTQDKLRDAEKGQSAINQAAERIKADVDAMKLQAEGNRVRAQSYIDQLQGMQLVLAPLLENLPYDISEQAWQQQLEKTKASLLRLGAVNLAAVEEFAALSDKKRYLDEQNDDLCLALETLESAIRKIDKETRSRFKATFEQINSDLKTLFPKVFGGGNAYLALTEDDMLDAGVTIMARPPGKKNSTIHLLSGGEKALTALSLVFAIFRLNPAPFCLLDEVDAPLDDANVGRFCKLVSEMSKTVQFIYITHNKVAMEMASHLTGVTMAEPGVSRMVAVDVEEAVAIAE